MSTSDDSTWFLIAAYLVPAFHILHIIFGLMIADAFPRCCFDRLKVIHTKLITNIRQNYGAWTNFTTYLDIFTFHNA
jgi:hypothetical protein